MTTSTTSLIDLLQQADIVVQAVMLSLVLASIWSWAIIFDKFCRFFILKRKTSKFEMLFHSEKPLDDIFAVAKKADNHPFAKIFIAAVKEWKTSNVKNIVKAQLHDKKQSLKERITNTMQVSANKALERLESSMHMLAIIGSVAPFVGLFGTVWGIMNSFQGIAMSKNTSLAVVAPGIAEALLATAIGLFAAIPAVFFYNIYSNKVNKFADQMNNFAILVGNVLSRELDKN
jgi:biopolymer transport protein TolQ